MSKFFALLTLNLFVLSSSKKRVRKREEVRDSKDTKNQKNSTSSDILLFSPFFFLACVWLERENTTEFSPTNRNARAEGSCLKHNNGFRIIIIIIIVVIKEAKQIDRRCLLL